MCGSRACRVGEELYRASVANEWRPFTCNQSSKPVINVISSSAGTPPQQRRQQQQPQQQQLTVIAFVFVDYGVVTKTTDIRRRLVAWFESWRRCGRSFEAFLVCMRAHSSCVHHALVTQRHSDVFLARCRDEPRAQWDRRAQPGAVAVCDKMVPWMVLVAWPQTGITIWQFMLLIYCKRGTGGTQKPKS